MLLFCRTDMQAFSKLVITREKSSEVRNADVSEAGGDGTFQRNRPWSLGCCLIGPKATLQTGSDTGEGAQETQGRAVMFSFLCVPIPWLSVARCQVKGGWREERGQQSRPMS